jgi:hypothetical protein
LEQTDKTKVALYQQRTDMTVQGGFSSLLSLFPPVKSFCLEQTNKMRAALPQQRTDMTVEGRFPSLLSLFPPVKNSPVS